MFNGTIPIVLDSLKQHYFIDRDGKMFRHILNYLRSNRLNIPTNYNELDLLIEEAKFYQIPAMIEELQQRKAKINNSSNFKNGSSSSNSPSRRQFVNGADSD